MFSRSEMWQLKELSIKLWIIKSSQIYYKLSSNADIISYIQVLQQTGAVLI